jgi:hypothetical protein
MVQQPQPSQARDGGNPWQITGVTIGAATRKASVTFAATVTKASVSIAKSF